MYVPLPPDEWASVEIAHWSFGRSPQEARVVARPFAPAYEGDIIQLMIPAHQKDAANAQASSGNCRGQLTQHP
jgi:hypothetical protein